MSTLSRSRQRVSRDSAPRHCTDVIRDSGFEVGEEGGMVHVAESLKMFIGGEWVDAEDGDRLDVFNPATGEVIATVPNAKAADVHPLGCPTA